MPISFKTLIGLLVATLLLASSTAETLSQDNYRELRKESRERERRLVFHSDGVSMDPEKQYLEANKSVLPHLPGTQTDACTYSLIHQFPVVRLYRTKVGEEHPPGIIEKLYGNGPDGLEEYIDYCHRHNFEAFWAMRTNDTHDSGNDEHGRRRLQSNQWKLENPHLLVGTRDNPPPYAGWSAYDYAQSEVREHVFLVLEEVCRNYKLDGIVLDFFRHLPAFKSTAWGGRASNEEREMLTSLLRRTREMLDKVGAKRKQAILLSVRTPDGPDYCRALGLDIERWMKAGLIDIWITTGYFRLREWEETVKIGHKYDVQVWASMDESRVVGRENRNSLEAYRARIMNAWRAGVDAIWMFNFFYYPDDPQFQLLFEAGDPTILASKSKTYVADARGQHFARFFLKGGETHFSRPETFSPGVPHTLAPGASETVAIIIGDDFRSARNKGFIPRVTLRIQASPDGYGDRIAVSFNNAKLQDPVVEGDWINFALDPSMVVLGPNQVKITGPAKDNQEEVSLRDLQISTSYKRN